MLEQTKDVFYYQMETARLTQSQKCKWDKGAYIATDRYCEDYIYFQDKYSLNNPMNCLNLKSTSPKICIFENLKTCRQEYEKCENGNNDETLCKTIRPLNNEKTGYDHFNKCSYSGTSCEKTTKKCEDYEQGFDNEEICSYLQRPNNYQLCKIWQKE